MTTISSRAILLGGNGTFDGNPTGTMEMGRRLSGSSRISITSNSLNAPIHTVPAPWCQHQVHNARGNILDAVNIYATLPISHRNIPIQTCNDYKGSFDEKVLVEGRLRKFRFYDLIKNEIQLPTLHVPLRRRPPDIFGETVKHVLRDLLFLEIPHTTPVDDDAENVHGAS